MMYAFIAAGVVATLSLLGALFFRQQAANTTLHRFILPVAVGVFLSVVFFELIPETIAHTPEIGPWAIVAGFLGFYALSHLLRTFHHHHDHHDECVGTGARLLLWGDAVHNVADGIVIASAFMVNPAVGIATTIGIALHEIPQEIAEFGVLITSGFSRGKPMLYNLFSASSIILGVFIAFIFEAHFEILVGIAAGNLLYIAATDLLPELQKSHRDHFWQSFVATIVGLFVMWALISYAHESIGHGTEEDGHAEEIHGDLH